MDLPKDGAKGSGVRSNNDLANERKMGSGLVL